MADAAGGGIKHIEYLDFDISQVEVKLNQIPAILARIDAEMNGVVNSWTVDKAIKEKFGNGLIANAAAAASVKSSANVFTAQAAAQKKIILLQEQEVALVQKRIRANSLDRSMDRQAAELRRQIQLLAQRENVETSLSAKEREQLATIKQQTEELKLQTQIASADKYNATDGFGQRNFLQEIAAKTKWYAAQAVPLYAGQLGMQMVQTIKDVESSIVEIMRVLNDANISTKEMTANVFDIAQEYGRSFDDASEVALRFAQAGYSVNEVLSLTRTSMLALNTAELNVEQSTQAMIGIMSQWGLSADDMGLVIDKINKTADNFPVTSQDLVDGLLRSSSAARTAKMSFEETIGTIVAMKEASGRTGKEVGNALNSIISYIQRPKSRDVFESLGIKVYADEAKTQIRPILDVIADMSQKWKEMGEGFVDTMMKNSEATDLFSEDLAIATGAEEEYNAAINSMAESNERGTTSIEAYDASTVTGMHRRNYYIALLNNFSRIQDVVNGQMDAEGYSMQENTRYMETLEAAWQQFLAAVQEVAVTIGEAGLSQFLKDAAGAGVELANGVAFLIKNFGLLPTTVSGAMGALALFGKGVKAIQFDVQNGQWITSTGQTFEKFGDIFKDFGTKYTANFNRYLDLAEQKGKSTGNAFVRLGAKTKALGATMNAAGVGAKVLSTALNTALNMAIGFGIGAIMQGITDAINKEKEAAEKAKEALSTEKERLSTIESLTAQYKALADANGVVTDGSKALDLQKQIKEALGDQIDLISFQNASYSEQLQQLEEILNKQKEITYEAAQRDYAEGKKTQYGKTYYDMVNESSPFGLGGGPAKGLYDRLINNVKMDSSVLEEYQKSIHNLFISDNARDFVKYANQAIDAISKYGDVSSKEYGQLIDFRDEYKEMINAEDSDFSVISKHDLKEEYLQKAQGELHKDVINTQEDYDALLEKVRLLAIEKYNMQKVDRGGGVMGYSEQDLAHLGALEKALGEMFPQFTQAASGVDILSDALASLEKNGDFSEMDASAIEKLEQAFPALKESIEGFKDGSVSLEDVKATLESVGEAAEKSNFADKLSEFKEGYKSLGEEMTAYDAAVKEQNENGYITQDTYDKLIEKNSDYANALTYENGVIKLNTEVVGDLHDKQRELLMAQAELEQSVLTDQYRSNSEAIAELNLQLEGCTDKNGSVAESIRNQIDALETENAALENTYDGYSLITSGMQDAITAYSDFQSALQGPEEDAWYEELIKAVDIVNDSLDEGKTNSRQYKAALELLFGDMGLSIEDVKKRIGEVSTFINSENGIEGVIAKFQDLGVMAREVNENGELEINIPDLDVFAGQLGISREALDGILQLLNMYGEVDLTGVNGSIQETANQASTTDEKAANMKTKLEEMAKLNVGDLGFTNLNSQLDTAQTRLTNILQKLANMPTTISTNVKVNTTSGSSLAGITAKAAGGYLEKDGDTLMGEEGPELYRDGDRAYVVGRSGPEIVKAKKGAQVFTAEETKDILNGSAVLSSLPAYATGASGGINPNASTSKKKKKKSSSSSSKSSGSGSSSKETEKEIDRYINLKKAIDDVNAAMERNDELMNQAATYSAYSEMLQERIGLYYREIGAQQALQAEYEKEAGELRSLLASHGAVFNADGTIENVFAMKALANEVDDYYGALKKAKDASNEILKITKELADVVRKEITDAFEHFDSLERYTLKQQIEFYENLLTNANLSIKDRWELEEKLYGLYQNMQDDLLKETEKRIKKETEAIKKKYDAEIEKEKEAIKKIQEERDKLNEQREEEDYEEKRKKLLEERYYHEQRTGQSHVEAIRDIDEQIADLDKEWARKQEDAKLEEQQKGHEDRIDNLEAERDHAVEVLEDMWEALKESFENGNLDLTAIAGFSGDALYKTYVDSFFSPLLAKFKELNAEMQRYVDFSGAGGPLADAANPGALNPAPPPVPPAPAPEPSPAPAGNPYGPASQTSGNIRIWAEGNQVRSIQWALAQMGYNLGSKGIDGVFGQKTFAAVRQFQSDHGVKSDGVVGKNTRGAFASAGYDQGGILPGKGIIPMKATNKPEGFVLDPALTTMVINPVYSRAFREFNEGMRTMMANAMGYNQAMSGGGVHIVHEYHGDVNNGVNVEKQEIADHGDAEYYATIVRRDLERRIKNMPK